MSGSVEWRSQDPRTSAIVSYSAADSQNIEKSYQQNRQGSHSLVLGGNSFTIDFSSMTQRNASGGSRRVIRSVNAPRTEAPTGTPTEQVRQVLSTIRPETIREALKAIAGTDSMCSFITENLTMFAHMYSQKGSHTITVQEVIASAKIDSSSVVGLLTVILQLMAVGTLSHSEIDFTNHEQRDQFLDILDLEAGQPVPPYYANVRNEGIFRRKFLSVLGLRNLCLHGPTIFGELFHTLFSSDPSLYNRTGTDKMKYYTGNVVDLDTVVLNCDTMLRSINEMRSKEKEKAFPNAQAFFNSDEAQKMVFHQSENVIKTFVDALGLGSQPDVLSQRRLLLDPKADKIPVATSNNERGRWPVWGYANVGVFTYHANVPHLLDVIGALLRAPFHIVKAFCLCLAHSQIIPANCDAPFELRLTSETIAQFIVDIGRFFSEAVNDSCFNAKWKAIEAFVDDMTSIDDIDAVISRMQGANQQIFTPKLFDEDDSNRSAEMRELIKLISGKGIQARDPKTKLIRTVCKQDVEDWIKKTTI